ncbi:sugar transferase [Streptomyces sp. NPDC088116]|uniref:sugar transferase n=1 Tax=Streptomyces sp. NPDC088116 TaxID=3365825 RepID=UPI003829182D
MTKPPRRPAGAPLRFGLPLFVADVLAVLVSTFVLDDEQRDPALAVGLVACVTVLNAIAGLYRPGVVLSGLDQLPVLAARIAVSWCVVAAVLAALFPARVLGFAVMLAGGATQLVVAGGCRSLIHTWRRAVVRNRLRSALVVGTGPAARRLTALLVRHPEYGLRPVGIVAPAHEDGGSGGRSEDGTGEGGGDGSREGDGSRDSGGTGVHAVPVLTTAAEVQRAVIQTGVQEVLFIGTGGIGSGALEAAGVERAGITSSGVGPGGIGTGAVGSGGGGAGGGMDRAALSTLFHEYGCAVSFIGSGPWDTTAPPGGMAHHLWGYTWRRVVPPAVRRRRGGTAAKRLLDVLIAGPILLAVSPVLLSCALAVRLCDGPGVLFRQERVGQNGRYFTLLKFRTLRPADDHESATRWNIADDLRMSPVGNFLRRTSLDELPQLWNVLRGDMSLVGPRPERPFFVANFSKTHPGYAARHRMPVGITGLAQVHGLRGDTSIEERSRFDNHYIDHWSLWHDVCILLRTAVSLVRPAGS